MNNTTTSARNDKSKHMNASDGFNKTMSHNLNIYRHVMDSSGAKQMYWAQHLRQKDNSMKEKLAKIPDTPFNVYGRDIKTQAEGKKEIIGYRMRGNTAEIDHLLRNRVTITSNFAQGYFDSDLRTYQRKGEHNEKYNSNMKERELAYKNTTLKDKKGQTEYPTFLMSVKDEKNLRNTVKSETEKSGKLNPAKLRYTAFDGRHQNMEYSKLEKFKTRNVNEMQAMFRRTGNMPNANWTLSLRS